MKFTRRDILRAAAVGMVGSKLGCSGVEGNLENMVTDMFGEVLFRETRVGSPIRVVAQDEDGQRLPGTNVAFVDSNDFRAFSLQKQGYMSHFQAYKQGQNLRAAGEIIEHLFNLVSGRNKEFTVFNHDREPVLAFEKWAHSRDYTFSRYMTREELVQSRDHTFQLISSLGGGGFFKVLSAVYDSVVKLDEWGVVNDLPDEGYFIFEPRNPTLPPMLIGCSRKDEVPSGVDTSVCGEQMYSGFIDEFNGDRLDPQWTYRGDGYNFHNGALVMEKGTLTSKEIELPKDFSLKYDFTEFRRDRQLVRAKLGPVQFVIDGPNNHAYLEGNCGRLSLGGLPNRIIAEINGQDYGAVTTMNVEAGGSETFSCDLRGKHRIEFSLEDKPRASSISLDYVRLTT